MTEWFSPETSLWFPYLSLMSLVAITAIWIKKGQHKRLVTGIYIACLGVGCLFLVAGLIARWIGQPDHVAGPLLLAGVVITVCFAATMPVMLRDYAKAEQRKMLAKDI